MAKNPDMDINADTKFAYKNVGYGLVSFEAGDDFVCFEGDSLYTNTFDRMGGMKWGREGWEFDGGLGMRCILVKKEHMTPAQISEAWGEQ